MFFVSHHSHVQLELTTPPEFCCNCGAKTELEYVETPLKQVRYFFIFGTELTLTEHFPYCAHCAKTAGRVRQGVLGKLLSACLATAVVFLVWVFIAESLPRFMSEHLFASAVGVGCLLTLAYFYLLDWRCKTRTHYQPVSLLDARVESGQLRQFRLRFYNPRYAALIAKANPELIAAGVLKVETRP